ncbi:hypothetical protein Taro_010344 [Colocasia esculenta]|uniref:Uncharacterized protein n=1 Tax=Colocasia esculenta TaxID=4460 RepID=A0A843U2S4_COLES|nr:hypothetical protein [Colocasia esculenta]
MVVEMSKKEGGGQEVEVMSTKKEKGGEEHEEMSKKKEEGGEDEEKEVEEKREEEEGGEDSRKDDGQDMDTIMQTLDKLADMDIFRRKLAWAIIQEVNEQKAQEMVCEQAEEKDD